MEYLFGVDGGGSGCRVAISDNKGNLIALETTENMLNKIQTKIVKFSVNKKVELIDTLKKKLKIIKNNEKELVVSYEKNIINIPWYTWYHQVLVLVV